MHPLRPGVAVSRPSPADHLPRDPAGDHQPRVGGEVHVSSTTRYVVWRNKVGHAWEMVSEPMSERKARIECVNRIDRAKAMGSGYRYYWFSESTNPND